jgi:hypothetical protein
MYVCKLPNQERLNLTQFSVCDELFKLVTHQVMADIVLYDRVVLHTFWLITVILLGVGILLDIILLICSLFAPRVAIGVLVLTFLLHSVAIIPQHMTSKLTVFK